jgi:hypothetical protein
MKPFSCVLFAVMVSCSPASAAVEQCRFIQSKTDREACYERQEKTLAAKRKPATPDEVRTKSLDEIQIENDRLSRSLRSICRGC